MRKSAKQQEAEMRAANMLRDLERCKTPTNWPRWPFLPVKHYDRLNGKMEIGVLVDTANPPTATVYDYCIFGDADFDETKIVATFTDLESMIAAGWVVD